MNTNWYYSDGQQAYGPATAEQLAALIQSGDLTADHFVVPEGSEDWQPIGASGFSAYLPPAPEAAPEPVPMPVPRAVAVRKATPAPRAVAPAKKSLGPWIIAGSLGLVAIIATAYGMFGHSQPKAAPRVASESRSLTPASATPAPARKAGTPADDVPPGVKVPAWHFAAGAVTPNGRPGDPQTTVPVGVTEWRNLLHREGAVYLAGEAFRFNNPLTSQKVHLKPNVALDRDRFSLFVRLNPETTERWQTIACFGPETRWFHLHAPKDKPITATLARKFPQRVEIESTQRLVPGKWSVVGCSLDVAAKKVAFYVDGQPAGSGEIPADFSWEPLPDNFQGDLKMLTFEHSGMGGPRANMLRGWISDVWLFGEALSDADVARLKLSVSAGANAQAAVPKLPDNEGGKKFWRMDTGWYTKVAPAAPLGDRERKHSTVIQTWTEASGATINATFVCMDGQNVVLRVNPGIEKTFAPNQLASESLDMAKELAATAEGQVASREFQEWKQLPEDETWISNDGARLRGKFVRIEGDMLVSKIRPEAPENRWPVAMMSLESQEKAKRLAVPESQPKQDSPPPAATVTASITTVAFEPHTGLCLGTDGSLYGTGRGTKWGTLCIFRIKPNGEGSAFYVFDDPVLTYNDYGKGQISDLISDGRDGFYGTIQGEGAKLGSVFHLSGTGAFTTVVEFTGKEGKCKGAYPSGGLIRDAAGNLYGATMNGGKMDLGTVFKLTPNGEFATLAEFTGKEGPVKGSRPSSNVVVDQTGNVLGVTSGSDGKFLFKILASGEVKTVATEKELGPGFGYNGLLSDKQGNVYGITGEGMPGNLFKLAPTGAISMVKVKAGSFSPYSLTIAANGDFYGNTGMGGKNDVGTVFKLTQSGELVTLVEFTGGPPILGAYPRGGLILDKEGNLYGVTRDQNTTLSNGTVFKISKAGAFKTVTIFKPQSAEEGARASAEPAASATSVGAGPQATLGTSAAVQNTRTNILYLVETTGGDVSSIDLQKDGKLLLDGGFKTVGGEASSGFARMNADGSLDSKFKPELRPTGLSPFLLMQPDGKVLMGGSFESLKRGIARLNANGSLDRSFKSDWKIEPDYGCYATILPTGKILFCAKFDSTTGVEGTRVIRLNADGTLDSSFKADKSYDVLDSLTQKDGRILIWGQFDAKTGAPRNIIARLNKDGSTDQTFKADASGIVRDVQQQKDGKLIVRGNFSEINGTARNDFARLNPDGTVDAAFNPNLKMGAPIGLKRIVNELHLQPDGKMIILGFIGSVDGVTRDGFARLNPDGTLDQSFGPKVEVIRKGRARYDYPVGDAYLQTDGKILLTGFFTSIGGVPRPGFARLNSDGTLDASFNPPAVQYLPPVALQPDGKIITGAELKTDDQKSHKGILRLNADGSPDQTFGQPLALAQPSPTVTEKPVPAKSTSPESPSPLGVWTWDPHVPKHRLEFTDAAQGLITKGDGTPGKVEYTRVSANEVHFQVDQKKKFRMVINKDSRSATISEIGTKWTFLSKRVPSVEGGQSQLAVPIVPSQFRGKTFDECERILGKPLSIQDPAPDAKFTDRSFIRTYASPIPGLAKIELFRAPEGGEDGPIGTTVNLIKYHFAKGKTWKECASLIGLSPDELTPGSELEAGRPPQDAVNLKDKGGSFVRWAPSASTMTLPQKMRNPDYDTLTF